MITNKILDLIMESNKIALTFHVSPDGDSIGSTLALYQGISSLKKDVYIISKEDIPEDFKFLPYADAITKSHGEVLDGTELVIVLDCGNFARVNANIDIENKKYIFINIDHHISNELYGDYNFVDPNAACMGEIVYQMLKSLDVKISKDIATCLYTSILTDTGSFRHSNTTSVTHCVAGDLITTGIDFSSIHRKIFDNKNFIRFKLYGEVFNDMELIEDEICVMKVTQEMFKKFNIDSGEDTSDIVSFGGTMKEVDVTLLLKEKDEEIKISLRSKSKVDVRNVAEKLGGGGHIRAAGASVKGKTLEEVKNIAIDLIKKELMK